MAILNDETNPLVARENARNAITLAAYDEGTSRAALIENFIIVGVDDDKAAKQYMLARIAVALYGRGDNALARAQTVLDKAAFTAKKANEHGQRTREEGNAYDAAKVGLSALRKSVKAVIKDREERAGEIKAGNEAFAALLAEGVSDPDKLVAAKADAERKYRDELAAKAKADAAAKAAADKAAGKKPRGGQKGNDNAAKSGEEAAPSNVVQFPRLQVASTTEAEALFSALAEQVGEFARVNSARMTGDIGEIMRDAMRALVEANEKLAALHKAKEAATLPKVETQAPTAPRPRTTRGK